METKHNVFEEWIKNGSKSPVSTELLKHFEECEQCSAEYNQILEFRSVYEEEKPEISSDNVAGIRFRLQAECNNRINRGTKETNKFKQTKYILLLAAIIVSVIVPGTIFLSLKKNSISRTPKKTPALLAVVSAKPGAKWHYISKGKTEIIELETGEVKFTVNHLNDNEIFGVKVGQEWVEVRGTIFNVVAKNGVLENVNVDRGVVSIHFKNKKEDIILLAGQKWKREPPRVNKLASGKNKSLLRETFIKRNVSSVKNIVSIKKKPHKVKVFPIEKIRKPKKEFQGKIQIATLNKESKIKKTKPLKTLKTSINKLFSNAYLMLQSGNWRKSINLFRDLLNHPKIGHRRKHVLFWLGQAYIRGKIYKKALFVLKQFLKEYPNSWRTSEVKKQVKALNSLKK